jgi:hypothetical protein
MSVLQLRKRSLLAILICRNSLDDEHSLHCHSKSHDGGKIQEKFDRKDLVRCPHPPYSPDLSLCNFESLEMAKEQIKDRECRTVQDILRCLTEICNDLTFEDVQFVFREWQIRLNWVMENGREN